jgi:hypothetical protein
MSDLNTLSCPNYIKEVLQHLIVGKNWEVPPAPNV